MTTTRWAGAALLIAGAAACGGTASNPVGDLQAATPDVAGLALETSGGAAEGLASTGTSTELASAAVAAAPSCQPYQYLCNIHSALDGLNRLVRAAIGPVEALADTPPTSVSGDAAVFGPVAFPSGTAVADFRLTVRKSGAGSFEWELQGKPVASADGAYVVVAAGRVQRAAGDLPHRGHGALAIDLDALASLNPVGAPALWNAEGKVLVGFGHAGPAKAVVYALDNFSPDRIAQPSVTSGVLAGYETASGVARVRVVSQGEYLGPTSGTDAGPEDLLSRAGWFPGKGGRAAVVVSAGDVPAYGVDFFLGLSCFDATEKDVYRALYGCKAGVCTLVDNAPAGYNTGDRSACDPLTDIGVDDLRPPSTDRFSAAEEPGAPAVPDAPPAGMASVTF